MIDCKKCNDKGYLDQINSPRIICECWAGADLWLRIDMEKNPIKIKTIPMIRTQDEKCPACDRWLPKCNVCEDNGLFVNDWSQGFYSYVEDCPNPACTAEVEIPALRMDDEHIAVIEAAIVLSDTLDVKDKMDCRVLPPGHRKLYPNEAIEKLKIFRDAVHVMQEDG